MMGFNKREALWREIEDKCEWCVSTMCLKAYDDRRAIERCRSHICPLVDLIEERVAGKEGTDG